jgi:branched-chain amino acid transport system substrate-binding protein
MLSRLQRGLLIIALLLASLLLLSCGEEKEGAAGTPAVTQPAGGGTPAAQEVPGVTDTEIVLGAHFPLSQSPAAVYASAVDAMRAYYEYVNSQGGIYGRKITFLVGDDHFNPADAVEVVRKLVEQNHVFAMAGALGPAHLAVYQYLEEQGVPDLWVAGGLTKFTDPVIETLFGGTVDYDLEGKGVAKYVIDNYNGKKVSMLVQNDEMGAGMEEGFRKALKGSDVQIVGRETCELTDTDLTRYAQSLKTTNPDVVVLLANLGLSANFVKVARDVVAWDVPLVGQTIIASEILPALAGSKNAEGLVAGTFAKLPSQTDDPGIQRHKEIMQQFAPNVSVSTLTIFGQLIAELTVKALENAGPNLTRESLVEGAEAIRDWCCSLCLYPVNLSPTDHRPFETIRSVRWQNDEWVQFGEPVSSESTPGKLTSCEGVSQAGP